jgi:hypothetical protein
VNSEWILLVEEPAETATFTYIEATGVIRSYYYRFKYLALNSQGYGAYSEISIIQASARPAKLDPVVIEHVGIMVEIKWLETPDTHGTPVTSYTITIE